MLGLIVKPTAKLHSSYDEEQKCQLTIFYLLVMPLRIISTLTYPISSSSDQVRLGAIGIICECLIVFDGI